MKINILEPLRVHSHRAKAKSYLPSVGLNATCDVLRTHWLAMALSESLLSLRVSVPLMWPYEAGSCNGHK